MHDLAPAREQENWLAVYDRVVAANDPVYLDATVMSG
jgi:hypothetical protein